MNQQSVQQGRAGNSRTGWPWVRHAAAVVVSGALNLALLAGLGWWSATTQHAAEPVWPTVPLRVVDAVREQPRVKEAERLVVVAAPLPEPGLASLPLPQLARLPALHSALVAPDSIGLPPFNPAKIMGLSPPLIAPASSNQSSPTWSNTRSAALIQPPDLSLYYPYAARLKEITGHTRLRVRVGTAGKVTEVDVLSGQPPGVFDSAARRVAHSLRFQPALEQGQPVPSEVTIAIEWRLPE